ncbi:hypothetical protein GE21DRAFT_1289659 [Neurospora crassa]|nr:hypothetical protein GE21DRAFT_1289659 [Neurospora crassa]
MLHSSNIHFEVQPLPRNLLFTFILLRVGWPTVIRPHANARFTLTVPNGTPRSQQQTLHRSQS